MQKDIVKTLSGHHLKSTSARRELLSLLSQVNTPVDAAFLVEKLEKKLGIDRVTVFRMLNVLTKHGIVRKLEFGEGKARYELFTTDHHHFICDNCGTIEDISDCNIEALEKEISAKKHIRILRHSLEFYGLCEKCSKLLKENIGS